MTTIKLGLLGLGTVGGGTLRILQDNAEVLRQRVNARFEVTRIAVRDLNKPRTVDTGGIALTDNPHSVVEADDVDVVVELMGGTGLARELVLRAIENGKHVVTANKALLAEHGDEVFSAAARQGVQVAYEAAVAGGIPIIKALREGLSANRIDWVAGIINGTGNYILTEMKQPGADFAAVLRRAQELGYAEADPTFDVEGIDAAHKLTILAALAFGMPLRFDRVHTEGISRITADDMRFADMLGYEIKHLGIARRTDAGVSLRVHPTLIPKDVLLASVSGVMNAVMTHGDQVGPTLYYGPGAGAGPTASAVVADLVDVARGMTCGETVPALGFREMADLPVLDMEQVECACYLRFLAKDAPGVLARFSSALAEEGISIEHMHQEPCEDGSGDALVVLITDVVTEAAMNRAIRRLEALEAIDGSVQRIRIETLN
ncbi:homoserine dehydrogenase [Sulfurivirga sp.]|uniref:homoserine dehydrogenase n=1 Tax=Sulfurivirga sp. TaxID=2614236 RepID=UPI0025EA1CBB|nr:homoserine dehydrogenase [Sulfurivirga sp.]